LNLTTLALASLVAALTAMIARAAQPFDHGIWLVAYLFLVGFLAQLLLGRGQVALLDAAGRPPPAPRTKNAQLVLWNAGVIAVPFGVLVDARLAVLAGSLTLLTALASLWDSVRPALARRDSGRDWRVRGYAALLVFMVASVLLGAALAWDIPWL